MSAERQTPRIIPVLDVMNGRVVRAIGGLREQYQPISCPFSGSPKPFDVANALLQQSRANELYIADLDTILGTPRVSRAVQTLIELRPIPMWLDVGIGRKLTVAELPALPHVRPVIGSETCGTPELLQQAVAQAGGRPVAFSIDLKNGRLLGNWRSWGLEGEREAVALARCAVGLGVHTLIVLDLARVGTGTGSGTEPLLTAIREEFPDVELIAGGGVKTWADIDRLGAAGADALLVASALHDGTIRFPRPTS